MLTSFGVQMQNNIILLPYVSAPDNKRCYITASILNQDNVVTKMRNVLLQIFGAILPVRLGTHSYNNMTPLREIQNPGANFTKQLRIKAMNVNANRQADSLIVRQADNFRILRARLEICATPNSQIVNKRIYIIPPF
ncbi:hypothetical protein BA763_23285 [Burkholderia cenocepacia]|nr:hypothetical protein BA763_23285 [Burkholderia cenocepacia]